ncbi:MAG: hypothetical protein V7632_1765 [Bradyrhizobium sp.]
MRATIWLAAAALLTFATPARAERPDCATFPDTRSRLTCYENVSRAPPEPEAKPAATAPKPTRPHRRKSRAR